MQDITVWPEKDDDGECVVDLLNELLSKGAFGDTDALRIYVQEEFPDIWKSSPYLRHFINFM